jgi:hypothetical protein
VYGSTPKRTDYSGQFIYENNALSFVNHEEGRVLMTATPEYQYDLKDHLGNVRVRFSEKNTTAELKTTLEESANSQFNNYKNRSAFSLFNNTPGGTYSQLLNGGVNTQVGLAKSYQVNSGETFDLEVYAKYEAPSSTAGSPDQLLGGLIAALGISSTGTTPLDGQQAMNAFNAVYGPGPIIGRTVPREDDVAPRAYLNYLLFDENFALVDFGFDQISNAAKQVGATPIVAHDFLSLHVRVKKKGYLYIYLSNEQAVQTNVYFDDFKIVRHTASRVVTTTIRLERDLTAISVRIVHRIATYISQKNGKTNFGSTFMILNGASMILISEGRRLLTPMQNAFRR